MKPKIEKDLVTKPKTKTTWYIHSWYIQWHHCTVITPYQYNSHYAMSTTARGTVQGKLRTYFWDIPTFAVTHHNPPQNAFGETLILKHVTIQKHWIAFWLAEWIVRTQKMLFRQNNHRQNIRSTTETEWIQICYSNWLKHGILPHTSWRTFARLMHYHPSVGKLQIW